MFTPRDFVWMIGIPGVIGLMLSFIGTFLKWRAWTAPLAVALAFLVAFPFIQAGHFSLPKIPPPTSMGAKGWLPTIAILALIAGLADSFARLRPWVRAILVAVVSAAGLCALLKFKFAGAWTPAEGAGTIVIFAILAAIWGSAIEDNVTKQPVTSLLILWLICSVSAVVLMLIATLDYGQFCIVLAACAFSFLPATLWKSSPGALRGLATTFSILFISLLAGAYYTSELGTLQLAILATPPVFVFLGRWLPIRWRAGIRSALRIAVTLIPLATALALATVRFHHEQQAQQEDQMY